jgi:hypothetical protein
MVGTDAGCGSFSLLLLLTLHAERADTKNWTTHSPSLFATHVPLPESPGLATFTESGT